MPIVDLVYEDACPNAEAARSNLKRALARSALPLEWNEHRIGSTDPPPRVRGFGSPTILVDGVDVAGLGAGAESCCRLYEGGVAPSVELIVEALAR